MYHGSSAKYQIAVTCPVSALLGSAPSASSGKDAAAASGINGNAEVVLASSSAVPFYWDNPSDPATLPDGGVDYVVAACAQRATGKCGMPHLLTPTSINEPNSLAGILIVVAPECRSRKELDIASMLLNHMRRLAVQVCCTLTVSNMLAWVLMDT